MSKPKQPQLTFYEKKYFKNLSMECDCNVSREIDTRSGSVRLDKERTYFISLSEIKADLNNMDSLKIESRKIANELHNKILKNKFEFEYQKITVNFSYQTGKSSSKDKYFDYQIK